MAPFWAAVRRLTDRWEMGKPSIDAIWGPAVYLMFEGPVTKMRAAV